MKKRRSSKKVKHIKFICEYCGREYTLPDHKVRLRKTPTRFCSRICHDKGKGSYKTSDDDYCREWLYRALILQFGKVCEIKGCNYDKIVEAHHIIPRREGGRNIKNNAVLLCPNHHAEADRDMISKSELFKIIKNRKERFRRKD